MGQDIKSNYISRLSREALEIAVSYDKFKQILTDLLYTVEFEHRLRSQKPYTKKYRVDKAIFIGDVHGDFDTLLTLLDTVSLYEELVNGAIIVFLGDYIDRGPQQIEVLAFLALLKNEWNDRIVMLRGNHEPPRWLLPSPHDYPEILMERFGFDKGRELYELSLSIFENLPLALYLPGKVLALHGGPPINRVLRYSDPETILDVRNDNEAIEDILWSDPSDDIEDYLPNMIRGAGKLWGPTITKTTIEKLNVKLIIRGHEPVVTGYRLNHDKRVLTLFSMKGYYGNIYAAALKAPLDDVDWIESKEIEKYIVIV